MRLARRSPRNQPRPEAARKAKRLNRPGRRGRYPALPGIDRSAAATLVVGLGNPGNRYRFTRHNAGIMAADTLLEGSEVEASRSSREGRLYLARRGTDRFLVLKPETYMNCSGEAVSPVVKYYGIAPEKLIVLHDDIDIPTGEARTKRGGGTAGHKGLASIVREIGTGDFRRIRIGVGRPPAGADAAEYVLEKCEDREIKAIRAAAREAAALAVEQMTEVQTGE